MYDCIIIGGGPSGLTAAIYLSRGGFKTLLLEKAYPGGQIALTNEMENFPGLDEPIGGMDFAFKLENQAKRFGTEIVYEEVKEFYIDGIDGNSKIVKTEQNAYKAKTVIIATGAKPRRLSVPGESRLSALGVSYCATCDGMLYKGKDVMVVGGGDTAVEDAIYLSRICKKVYLVHRRNQLRAAKILTDKLIRTANIEVIWDSVINEIHGDNNVEYVTLSNVKDNTIKSISIDALFIAIGYIPNSELLKDAEAQLSPEGYILTDDNLGIKASGVFVAGDVRAKRLRQVITACADGAEAAQSVQQYLINN